jgi:hypothetical protein
MTLKGYSTATAGGKDYDDKPIVNEIHTEVVSVSQALRMHSGTFTVKDCMISGSRKLEKMISKSFFRCVHCDTFNESREYGHAHRVMG